MVIMPGHTHLLDDKKTQSAIISEEFYDMRTPRLKTLSKVEQIVRKHSPLPISYDISRRQPPYFNEFTYTELLGCIFVSPQSREAVAKIMGTRLTDGVKKFSIVDKILENHKKNDLDKYVLDLNVESFVKEVAFIPGSNIFKKMVSKEIFTRIVLENSEIMIKPHPLTNDDLLRILGIEFGYHRMYSPKESGIKILENCEKAYVTTNSEMGMYAILFDKEVVNISNFFYETEGVHFPFYQGIWELSKEKQKQTVIERIQSVASGVFHPEDPDLEENIVKYFNIAMDVRETLRPYCYEYSASNWPDLLNQSK